MRAASAILALTWAGLWFTPDQQGQRLFRSGDFQAAAERFQDPLWQGAAWYRAGEFEKAAAAFSRRDSPEAFFNQGNAWLMRGKYDAAINAYEKALQQRPDWPTARTNREIAAARAKLLDTKGGDLGDQKLGADKVVFDGDAKNDEGQETQVAGEKALGQMEIQALWLRQVTTRPADFLKSKFAYQFLRAQEDGIE